MQSAKTARDAQAEDATRAAEKNAAEQEKGNVKVPLPGTRARQQSRDVAMLMRWLLNEAVRRVSMLLSRERAAAGARAAQCA